MFRSILQATRVQIGMGILLVLFVILPRYGILPSPTELSLEFARLFDIYGPRLVVVLSFLENIVGFNAYFPGSMVILAAMALTAGDPFGAVLMYGLIVIPAALAEHVNFAIGRVIGSKGQWKPPAHLGKLWLWFFSTFWHPHLAALTSFACGAEGVPYRTFLPPCIVAGLTWGAFWAFSLYHFGQFIMVERNLLILVATYIAIWFVVDAVKATRESYRSTRSSHAAHVSTH
jgi:membrane protein DedA with SNARE-associated domain